MKTSSRILIFANLPGFLAVLAINYLSNSLPLNGKTPGQLSDQYPNLFTPAGLTFSIWGIIYLWLLVWVGAQVFALLNRSAAARIEPSVAKSGWLFFLSCLLNIGWLFAWHWEQLVLSVVVMLGLFITLLRLNRAAGVGFFKSSQSEKRLSHLPFGIYQGWISVALIANVTAVLVSRGWHGGSLGEMTWAILMVLAGATVAVLMLFRQNNIGHGSAVAWALLGIFLKRNGSLEAGSQVVAFVALASMVAVLVVAALRWRKWMAY